MAQRKSEDTLDLISLVRLHNGKMEVDDNALVELLSRPDVKDRPLAIISVAGAFRTGKSFIMNFFIRYLRSKGWKNPDWFGNPNTVISCGFPVKRGAEACTKGINIWPEVFHMPLADEREAAVLLVDTQGLFDGDTSPDANARIMSISTMFSSHQILNITKKVDERHLEHLQLCNEFAKAAQRKVLRQDASKPFQALTFLIRDWEWEFDYPLGDSPSYLKSFLKRPSQSSEVQEIKNSISKAFSDIGGILLPHPGREVTRHDGIGLKNREIDEDFQKHAKAFVESVLHPSHIKIKKSADGRVATADGLQDMIGAVGNEYKSGGLPEAQTMLKAVVHSNGIKAMRDGILEYMRLMRKHCEKVLNDEQLNEYHVAATEAANERFAAAATLGDDDANKKYIEQLREECKQFLESRIEQNKWRKKELGLKLEKVVNERVSAYKNALKQVGLRESDDRFESVRLSEERKAKSTFTKEAEFARTIIKKKVKELEEKLRTEIEYNYRVFKEAREREKEKKRKTASENAMNKILRQFGECVDQYDDDYYENLQKVLKDKQDANLAQYDKEMANNSQPYVQKNRQALNTGMVGIIENAKRRNISQKKIVEGNYEKIARELANEYENSHDEVLSKSYVEPSCLEYSKENFLRDHVYSNEKYKAMPEWGKSIVENEIISRSKTIKNRNEKNKEYRNTKVDDSNLLMKILKAGWNAIKSFFEAVWNFFVG